MRRQAPDDHHAIHVGCCGRSAARRRYFREFDAVEVQQTFYEPPRLATLARWRQEASADYAWVLFNNMSMWDDARRFKQLLARPV